MKILILRRLALIAPSCFALCVLLSSSVEAQDVPGIEICTVEKTMERRTSCLQSNVDFLQKTIVKLSSDHQQKLDAANRQIELLKASVASLQKTMEDLQATKKKPVEEQKTLEGRNNKASQPPAKDSVPPKEGGK
jgi:prophage DNA circulation protein